MNTNTRDKLDEARYFLNQMQRIQQKQASRDYFRYKLSAFLAAFRSVPHIILSEYGDARDTQGTSGFQAWFDREWSNLRKNNDIDFLIEARNATIHERPVRPSATYSEHLGETIGVRNSVSWVLTRADGSVAKGESIDARTAESEQKKPETRSFTKYYFTTLPPRRRRTHRPVPDPPSKDVVTVCAEGLAALDRFVAKAEARFRLL